MKKTAQFILVTPEQAKEWAEKNTINRKFRRWYALALAEAIKRGEWITTHQGVAFSVSGKLLDGQHRLWAIIWSGIAAEMLVVTGIDDRAFMVIDRGLGRTYTDVTGLPKKTAELAAIAARYLYKSGKPSPQQVVTVANAVMSDIQEKLQGACAANVKILTSAPIRLAAALMLMRGYDEEFILSQYRALATRDYQKLTVTSSSFLRRVGDGEVNVHDADDVITRAMRCFNPTEQNLKKIYAGEEQRAQMRQMLCETLTRVIK